MENSKTQTNWIDKAVNYFNPKAGAERLAYRQAQELQAATYQGAVPTRVSVPWGQSESMGAMPSLNLTAARDLRDRARQLCLDNPLASSILNRATENVVGSGFKPQALSASPVWNLEAEKRFHDWTFTADYYGRSWVQHQYLVCNGLFRDGDIGSALLSKGQLQLVEGDYISTPYGMRNAFYHDGIELDLSGCISKFWIMQYIDQQNKKWSPVAPKNFIYLANIRRNAQYRGETYFAQSFDGFDQLNGYMKAVVLAQKIAACLSIFITRADPTAALQGLGTGKNITDGSTQRQTTLEPGLIMYGQNGETIQQVNPAQPGSGFDTNVRMIIRLLGLGFGLPLEYALLDFSTVSGATAKASAQAAQRAFERVQRLLIDEYYSRVWRWRISKFIKDGELEDRDDAFNHRWHADRWPYLDVVKEIQGIQAEIDAGLTTETRELMSRGINVDQIQQERATELANKRKLGIPIYHANIMLEVGTKAPVSTEETVGSDTKDTNVPPTDPAGPTESPLAE